MLDSSVSNFADYAAQLGINYKILKLHNPWLRDNVLENKSGKAYAIKLPADLELPEFPEPVEEAPVKAVDSLQKTAPRQNKRLRN